MVEVVVEFEYTSNEDDELTIKPGDIIKDVVKMAGGWWEGTLNGKRGMFPDNFVKEIKKEKSPATNKKTGGGHVSSIAKNLSQGGIKMGPPPTAAKAENKQQRKKILAKVTFAYTPQHDDELELAIGEVIEVTKQEEEGWWEGIKKGAVGVFPSNFVELIREESIDEDGNFHEIKGKKVKGVGLGNIFEDGPIKLKSANREDSKEEPRPEPKSEPRKDLPQESKVKKITSPVGANDPPALPPKEIKEPKPPERAKVLYSYKAENLDELTLEEGDIITVLEKELEDSGWWRGELRGKIGVFPDNFVELLPPEEVRPKKPPPPSLPKEPSFKSEGPIPLKVDEQKEEKTPIGRKPAQPPPVSKKPLKHDEAKLIAQTDDMKAKEMDTDKTENHFREAEPTARLTHPTTSRVKAPERRPPKNKPHASKLDDLSLPEDHHHQPVAPNTLPQPKHVNPLQASEHPIPARPVVTTTTKPEEVTPPAIKEREEKKVPPVPGTRPPPPTPGSISPTASPRSPDGNQKVPAVDISSVDALKKELADLKASTVSRSEYKAMQQDLQHMREDIDKMRSQFNKKLFDLMKEVDDEKKIRLNMQVEIDRIKKLVFPDDD